MTGIFIRERKGRFRHRNTWERRPCDNGGKIAVIQLQAKECRGWLEATRSYEQSKKDSSLEPSEQAWPSWISSFQTYKKIVVLSHAVAVICHSSRRKLIYFLFDLITQQTYVPLTMHKILVKRL